MPKFLSQTCPTYLSSPSSSCLSTPTSTRSQKPISMTPSYSVSCPGTTSFLRLSLALSSGSRLLSKLSSTLRSFRSPHRLAFSPSWPSSLCKFRSLPNTSSLSPFHRASIPHSHKAIFPPVFWLFHG